MGDVAPARGGHSVVMKYVVMKYVGTTALLLRGPISGRVYALSPGHPGVQIDASDVGALAISPLFASPPHPNPLPPPGGEGA